MMFTSFLRFKQRTGNGPRKCEGFFRGGIF
nr:MAG TPA: hypothetical protein [Caudoviricetes sp.]DAX98177.1 MAG TPA: hypothetical protein [Caudoviricetes sp.]